MSLRTLLHLDSLIHIHSFILSLPPCILFCLSFSKDPLHFAYWRWWCWGESRGWSENQLAFLCFSSLFLSSSGCLPPHPFLLLYLPVFFFPLQPLSLGYPCGFSEPVNLSEKWGLISSYFSKLLWESNRWACTLETMWRKHNASGLHGLYTQLVIRDG